MHDAIVYHEDHKTIAERLPGMSLADLFDEGDAFKVSFRGNEVDFMRAWSLRPLAIATSKKGAETLNAAAKSAQELCGFDAPDVIDLSGETRKSLESAMLRTVVPSLIAQRAVFASRNADLALANAQMRQTHDGLQSSFRALEQFVASQNLVGRVLRQRLAPQSPTRSLALRPGEVLRQRLPLSTEGLCDVAIYPRRRPGQVHGLLTATLSTLEDGAVIAAWQLDADALKDPSPRLSLSAALGADLRTAVLSLSWAGDGDLALCVAMAHPDARFQAIIGDTPSGYVLAHATWTGVPGTELGCPAGTHLPQGTVARRRILLPEDLAQAEDATGANPFFGFIEGQNALQVHPIPGTVAAGVLADAVTVGATSVGARVRNASRDASPIAFSLGLVPLRPNGKNASAASLPDFAPGFQSPWMGLGPEEEGHLELALEAPLSEPCQLYLLSRMQEETADTANAWAWFDRVVVNS